MTDGDGLVQIHAKGRTRLIGASILPYAVDDVHGNVYWLLAKEQFILSWPAGSDTWGDFGGSVGNNEDAEDTAGREFQEESMGVLRIFEGEPLPRKTPDVVIRALKNKKYTFRMTFDTDACDGKGGKCRYVVFVMQVPWDPHVPKRFRTCREDLMHIHKDGYVHEHMASYLFHPAVYDIRDNPPHDGIVAKVGAEYIEKDVVRWWSAETLASALAGSIEHGKIRQSFAQRAKYSLREFYTNRLYYTSMQSVTPVRMLPRLYALVATASSNTSSNSNHTQQRRLVQWNTNNNPPKKKKPGLMKNTKNSMLQCPLDPRGE
jgi:hypothetical protein